MRIESVSQCNIDRRTSFGRITEGIVTDKVLGSMPARDIRLYKEWASGKVARISKRVQDNAGRGYREPQLLLNSHYQVFSKEAESVNAQLHIPT